MKKYSFVILLMAVTAAMTYILFSLSDIKTVQGTQMQSTYYSEYINVSGEFESQDKTLVMLSYPVYIKDVYVKENSYVNKGQALFTIDKEKMASFLSGEIDIEVLEQLDYDDISQLAGTKQTSVSNIYNLPDTIYASSDGIVSRISIYPGAIAMPNRHLVVLNHTDNILAKFTISQLDYGKISIGDSVSITPVAFQSTEYNGVISPQNAIIKKQSTAVGNKVVIDVFATITNADERVADGLQINGVVQSGEPALINTLDYSFINQDADGQFVYTFNKGIAEKTYIETGVESGTFTEILTSFPEETIFISGEIIEGDRVILAG